MDGTTPEIEMMRARVTATAQAIWRVSEPLWFDATLRDELRRNAVRAISAVGTLSIGATSPERQGIDTLLATLVAIEDLLRFAQRLSVVSDENVRSILRGYGEIKEYAYALTVPPNVALENGAPLPLERDHTVSVPVLLPTNSRQERIVEFIRANGQAQISEITRLFGEEVSEKTLQRDLLHLVTTGVLARKGDNRWTVYSYNTNGVQEETPEIAQ